MNIFFFRTTITPQYKISDKCPLSTPNEVYYWASGADGELTFCVDIRSIKASQFVFDYIIIGNI